MTGPADPARRRAHGAGLRAETLCAWGLRLRGYRILARRFAAAGGEVDLIARRGRVLAIIEVKARRRRTTALEAVTPRQRARVERAALAYLALHPGLAGLDIRFDVMAVTPWRLPFHLRNAWLPTISSPV